MEEKVFDVRVNTSLGYELVDVVNVLRALGCPEDEVRSAVLSRLTDCDWS